MNAYTHPYPHTPDPIPDVDGCLWLWSEKYQCWFSECPYGNEWDMPDTCPGCGLETYTEN